MLIHIACIVYQILQQIIKHSYYYTFHTLASENNLRFLTNCIYYCNTESFAALGLKFGKTVCIEISLAT